MSDNWTTADHSIYLPALFEKMGFQLVQTEDHYLLYSRGTSKCVVLHTEGGYVYYNTSRPEKKLQASQLIMDYVSKVEGEHHESIWEKVDAYYNELLKLKGLLFDPSKPQALKTVPKGFNHFETYSTTSNAIADPFYDDIWANDKFGSCVSLSQDNEILYPLSNLENEVCGYFVDAKNGVTAYRESAIENSLWYSKIPKTIDWLIIVKDPKEALAFDKKFELTNAVYLALGKINAKTTKILFQIHKLTKVKKMVLSFTGTKKIEGYLRDLHFISFVEELNFSLQVNDKDLDVRFDIGDEKSFMKLYNQTKNFNQGLAKSYLKHNKVLNQGLINQHSILVSKENETIKVRIPIEVNAIKFFVWCYYKNYLNKTLDVLKPKYSNWYLEWEATQSIQLKGKEEVLKDYRIAL